MEREEAIEVVKKNYPHVNESGSQFETALRTLIPELQESEDERIRKNIIATIHLYYGEPLEDEAKEMIYWLEKQGQQKQELLTKEKALKNSPFVEPKPADKVEPKFRKGDWIIHQGTENIYQVVARIDNQYQLKYGDNYTVQNCSDVERCTRLWDITKDAKDGDVLEYQGEIFIIRELKKKVIASRTIEYYCCYDGEHFVNNSIYSLMDDDLVNIHPSTQEQHNLLLQKMKEAGYEWDAKKLELKKNEQNPVWKQDNTGDLTDFENAMMHIGDSFFGEHQGLDPNDTSVVKEQAKLLLELVPKQEWSEDDENRVNRLIAYFEDKESFTAEDDVVYANWLKSLKDRYTWKPSEEQMEALDFAANCIVPAEFCVKRKVLKELLEQIKKLR